MNRLDSRFFAGLIVSLSVLVGCECGPDAPTTGPECVPVDCADLGRECGSAPDGCGEMLDCGECTEPGETCGGGGIDGVCGSQQSPDCVPRSCEEIGDYCGPMPNGCGSFVECVVCEPPETCGGGGEPSRCGITTAAPCERLTCEEQGIECGLAGDGCRGTIDCGDCREPGETCGGAGVPSRCGVPPCTPLSCSDQGIECGLAGDGCGNIIDCGGCPEGESCGGDNVPGQCGTPPCAALTCADQGIECGLAGDGCGGTIDCGDCVVDGETCGGGGVPSQCGAQAASSCIPLSCQDQGIECGMAGDGCGGTISCGDCPAGELCGGGGVPSQCGTPTCTPLTCADVGANCGRVGDGCGGLTDDCGSCTPPEFCGGAGVPNQCGEDPTGACTGLCPHQVYCPGGGATTVTGTVRAPNGIEPIYNAMVFVPNGPLPDIDDGIACLRCEDQDFGEILVADVTGSDGTFELRHVPADVDFPLVVQIGKWRRQVMISAVAPCSTTALTTEETRLPKNSDEGHIPRIAISTGRIDGLECVLYKAGVEAQEFTPPTGDGRIHIYRANGAWPNQSLQQSCSSNCTDRAPHNCSAACREIIADRLYENQSRLYEYDVVVFGCEASRQTRSEANRNRMRGYVNDGGRLFVSHWSLDWMYNWTGGSSDQQNTLYETDPLHTTCDWPSGSFGGGIPSSGSCVSQPCVTEAFVDESFDRGLSFSEWLDHPDVAASDPASGIVTIHEPRAHCPVPTSTGRQWIYTTAAEHGGDSVQQLTFNTPVGASDEDLCGRVVYSAFHVTIGATDNAWFPNHCSGPLTDQEKILLFMLFDLAACISDDDNGLPPCVPITCAHANAECGMIGDGCGGELDCGDCPPGQTCGGGGTPHQCGSPCTPLSCGPNQCGYIADGCGDVIDCGDCPPGYFCGGGGVPNECGRECTLMTCADWGAECGVVPDGCGGVQDCGDCPPGLTCGGDGVPNQCGNACVPLECQPNQCGHIADGCGHTVDCGPCPPGLVCGGGGGMGDCSMAVAVARFKH